MDAHCDTCAAYEKAVMAARADGREPAAGLEPCPDFVMSDSFQAWLVEAMRAEVLGQVQAAGLDRMAVLKPDEVTDPSGSDEDDEEE